MRTHTAEDVKAALDIVFRALNASVREVLKDVPEKPPEQVHMNEYMWTDGPWRYEMYPLTFGRARLTWGNDRIFEAEY